MPKVKWGIDPSEPDELEPFDVYDGPELKPGVYNGVIKRLTLKENKNGDDMLNLLFEVREEKGSVRARYNGAGVWNNLNVTDQGKPYVLAFLKSLGLNWRDFTTGTITEDNERPTKVVKIGRVKFNDGNEPKCRVSVGMSRASAEYPSRPEIKQFLVPKELEEWDDSDDDGDDEPDPFA